MFNFIKMGLLSLATAMAHDYKTAKICWNEIDRMIQAEKDKNILKYGI